MIKPFGTRLLVRRKTMEAQTEGGILLPTEVTEKKFNEGTVVSASEDCKITEGEYVIFGDYSGNEIYDSVSDEMLLLIMEDDVICTITEDE
jgi:co-chaperonin GroES (HSP10)|tara:strand:+ start:67 stop:339 length:273 start_codon:yes stop_codon:yes gene_type:complete